ncbi:MAG: hypothetical protein DRJ26_03965 [Candidatus Methanomethylicota archaeon]|uniref:Uncharacterized protein n=1 Tax=Thermoproteota archaeon TaxID=2056631 RepID=A0A497F0K1_9CREN|nr:MAG: hypothetical protein DRJ26_03965 [Candidatus Verstraetearchaeota archaeon]
MKLEPSKSSLRNLFPIGLITLIGITLIVGHIYSLRLQIANAVKKIDLKVTNSEVTVTIPNWLIIYSAHLNGTTLKWQDRKLIKVPTSIDILPYFENGIAKISLPEGNYTISMEIGCYIPLLGKITYDKILSFEVNPPPSIKPLNVSFTPPNEVYAILSIADPTAVNQSSVRASIDAIRAELKVTPVKVDFKGNGLYLASAKLSGEQLTYAAWKAEGGVRLELSVRASDITGKAAKAIVPLPDLVSIIASDLGVDRTKAIELMGRLGAIGFHLGGNATLGDVYAVMKLSPELLQTVYEVIEDDFWIYETLEELGTIVGKAVLVMKRANATLGKIPLIYPRLAAAVIGNATVFGVENATAVARAAILAQEIQRRYGWLGINLLTRQPEVLVAMAHLLSYIPELGEYPLELYSLSKAIGEWVYWDKDVVPYTKRRGHRLTGMILPIVPTSYYKVGKYPRERAWIADPSMLPAFYDALRELVVGWYLKRVQNGTFESLEEMLSSGCLKKALDRGLPKEIVLGAVVEFGDACVFYFTSIDYTGRESTASLRGGYSPWQLRNMSKMIAWLKANTQQLDRIYKQLEEVRKKVTPEMIQRIVKEPTYSRKLPYDVKWFILGMLYGDGTVGFEPCYEAWDKFVLQNPEFILRYSFRGAPTFLRLVAEPRISCEEQDEIDMFVALGWLLYNTPSSALEVDYPQPDMSGLGHGFFVFIDREGRLISPITIDIDRFPSCYYKYGWPPERISIGLFNTVIYGADEILKALRPGEPKPSE